MRRADGRCGPTRRDFLRTGVLAAGAAGLTLTGAAPASRIPKTVAGRHCIFLLLTGGPSQIDTWDPKPDAPADVRGPFQPIATRVPGFRFSELFPRMAARADRF